MLKHRKPGMHKVYPKENQLEKLEMKALSTRNNHARIH
jgi:hypothetical protein